MEFNSLIFITIFFPILAISYFFIKDNLKNLWLLIFGFIFYAWGSLKGLCIIIILALINYALGLLIFHRKSNKWLLALGVVINVLSLGYFKYTNFFIENINAVFGSDISALNILVPLGISFFVFKAISYLVDVYNNKVEAERNLIDFLLFMTFFSQVLSGPIVRYVDMKEELKNRSVNGDDIRYGLMRFVIGLAKKVFIANNLGILADSIWGISTHEMTAAVAWIGSLAYTLQIYFDFSGYSDMAIGLARVFGFRFKENFDYPYISRSITEFWRRWHISLSSWFRDYIYIPLGGSRTGNVYFNIFVVFLVTGIWHGSAWNFVIWGLWNGFFNIIEKFLGSKGYKVGTGNIVQKAIAYIYTMFVVNMGWVFFRAPGLKHACSYILSMFGLNDLSAVGYTAGWYLTKFNIVLLIVAIIFSVPILKNLYKKYVKETVGSIAVENVILIILMGICIMGVVSSSYNSFIYFQF